MDDDTAQWIVRLCQGEELAAQKIWERYYHRLVRLARKWLGDTPRRMADEEDVALSAFHSFCQAAAAGRFPRLNDRQDLWKLLVTITARKATRQIKQMDRKKRGGGAVRGESVFARVDDSVPDFGIDQFMGNEPTPEFAALLAEQCERLLDTLEDESLRKIALYKLEGYSNEEVSREMDCSLRTVKRRLARIRTEWQDEGQK